MPSPKREKYTNIGVGLVVVALALIFWFQRGYTTAYGGTFADPIIVIFGLLGVLLIGLTLAGRTVGSQIDGATPVPIKGLVIAVLVLGSWIVALPYLGYLISGILFYFITTLVMRTENPRPKNIILDFVTAIVVVGAFYYIFTEVLYVRLPKMPF